MYSKWLVLLRFIVVVVRNTESLLVLQISTNIEITLVLIYDCVFRYHMSHAIWWFNAVVSKQQLAWLNIDINIWTHRKRWNCSILVHTYIWNSAHIYNYTQKKNNDSDVWCHSTPIALTLAENENCAKLTAPLYRLHICLYLFDKVVFCVESSIDLFFIWL